MKEGPQVSHGWLYLCTSSVDHQHGSEGAQSTAQSVAADVASAVQVPLVSVIV
jgi:hypothetical protein